eukprot:TRINITY_DN27407_c0_g1_i1.p1 TRINITY_DN27407_c0_g1~~TRINITY_DN27407_c0_g1_i1.p1  ORF type:complete len:183 (-),score=51.65 TRINITY_DN27407_c0_g1_i1:325-873(-)
MSAHFDGGEVIEGRRLREVHVIYVEDPTLQMGDSDEDSCPPTPPPTYYLKVLDASGKWKWRYVDVEHGELVVWTRRGGTPVATVALGDVTLLRVAPEPEGAGSQLEVHTADRGAVVTLQARSGRETELWGQVLQENIRALSKADKRKVRLEVVEGAGGGTGASTQRLAELLTAQLSELALHS